MDSVRQGVFSTLPASFFSPLSSPNREHYAALLSLFYRSFQESTHGVERNVIISKMTDYINLHRAQIAEEDSENQEGDEVLDSNDFTKSKVADEKEASSYPETLFEPARALASRMLNRLVRYGWLSVEELPDYTRVINIQPWAKPFLEALAKVEEGLKTEYESHVVAIYSLLNSDAASENGHYAVLNAHEATVALGDSLKVLSQSIKEHYERLSTNSTGSIPELLHLHYDLYADDILEGAYRRLKTSDNLSRYRPRILRRIAEFLTDRDWIETSALKYSRTSRCTVEDARQRLATMLEEIRDILRSIDPLLDEIDRRNMLYAKVSVERVRAMLEPESSIAGRIIAVAHALAGSKSRTRGFTHHLYQVRLIAPESRYRRWLREALSPSAGPPGASYEGLEQAEAELRLRLERQLGPNKIAAWLDEAGGTERPLTSSELVTDVDSFVRLLYAVLYADGRKGRFRYFVENGLSERVISAGYEMPDLVFRGRK